MRKYIFKIAKIQDIKKIMNFIRNYWDKNHILAKNIKFFLYEFQNKKKLNFILAINQKKIEAIQGFILYGRRKNSHVCGSITCVKKKTKLPFIGILTMQKMLEINKPKTYCGIGTNPKTMFPLVSKFFKRTLGIMDHFYILNNKYNNYKIAKIKKKNSYKSIKNNNYKLNEIFDFKDLKKKFNFKKNYKNLPLKESYYLKKRYFNHPIYKYKFFCQQNRYGNFRSFFVAREVCFKDRKALSIVDYRGEINDLGRLKESLIKILNYNKYEYIDLVCTGLNSKILERSGFIKKKKNDLNIIPTYFNPFIKKNVNIYYEKSHKKLILFKGDADGDRPRI
jgi:hypothetical protein